MTPTLLSGDWVLMNRLLSLTGDASHRGLPRHQLRRGDVVIFHYPGGSKELYVKRIIAIPGDHLRIIAGRVRLNGLFLFEPYIEDAKVPLYDYLQNFPQEPTVPVGRGALQMLEHDVQNNEIVVPPESLFVLGDERKGSFDSRYWGFIPERNVIGVGVLVAWSGDPDACSPAAASTGGCAWRSIRWSRFFHRIQ